MRRGSFFSLLVVLVSALTFLTACNHLVLDPADSTAARTGKVIARGLLLIPTFGASERRINRYRNGVPVTDGFHSSTSNGNETVVIVGSNQSAINAATIWLQKRGLSVLERSQLDQILVEQQLRLVRSSDDDAVLLHVGRIAGASHIVFIDATSSAVSIRAVDLESGKIGWTGRAHYRDMRIKEPGDPSMTLTCQALATAWGFREPGDIYIPSQQMCDLRDPRPKG
ncbi:MAG TPA: hypothetical protein VFL19_00165 [Nitrospira sp.]|nr:hypothetical protein [Nitrospira sp.]